MWTDVVREALFVAAALAALTGCAAAGPDLQAMQSCAPIAYDHMSATPLKGTTEWTRCEITLAIPAAADQIDLGAMLRGPATLWLVGVELDVLPR